MSDVDAAIVAAWQAALAAEHQAAFGYPLLGPQLSGAERERAAACQLAHETLRDATAARIAAAGTKPVAPRGDYAALYPVDGAAAARVLAARLEHECAAAWRYLYAQAALDPGRSAVRRQSQDALTASAVRAVRWSGTSTAFPGIG